MGRVARSDAAWTTRVALAERPRARVITDLKMAAAFPTDHPLHAGPPGNFLAPECATALRAADVVLALDWYDVAGTLKQAFGNDAIAAHVINVSPDAMVHRGWSMDYQGLAPADDYWLCAPDRVVDDCSRASRRVRARRMRARQRPRRARRDAPPATPSAAVAGPISIRMLADALNAETAGRQHLPHPRAARLARQLPRLPRPHGLPRARGRRRRWRRPRTRRSARRSR